MNARHVAALIALAAVAYLVLTRDSDPTRPKAQNVAIDAGTMLATAGIVALILV